jgi:hypothetical protein
VLVLVLVLVLGGARVQTLATGSHPVDQNRPAQSSLLLRCKYTFQLK